MSMSTPVYADEHAVTGGVVGSTGGPIRDRTLGGGFVAPLGAQGTKKPRSGDAGRGSSVALPQLQLVTQCSPVLPLS
jgi:hypothetical protein